MTSKPSSSSSASSLQPTPTSSYQALFPVPSNVAALYKIAQRPVCNITLDTLTQGFSANGDGGRNPRYRYCGSSNTTTPDVVWWLSNMDVDCDGSGGRTGPCSDDRSYYNQTSFEYKNRPLDAQQVPFGALTRLAALTLAVVMNDQKEFHPSKFGFNGLDTIGVVCNGALTFAVYGDQNGDSEMGEGSLRLAQNCFGPSISGNMGHDTPDVLYFAFSRSADPLAGTDFGELMSRGSALLPKLDAIVAALA